MILDELDIKDYKSIVNSDKNIWELEDFLDDNGYKEIGSGYFSTVYSKPNSSVVLKIGKLGRIDSFINYINYVRKNPRSVNLPRIGTPRWLKHQWNVEYYVVPMEKLQPLTREQEIVVSRIEHYLNSKDYKVYLNKKSIKEFQLEEHVNLLRILKDLEKVEKRRYDIKSDNFMRRGDNIVITDPIA